MSHDSQKKANGQVTFYKSLDHARRPEVMEPWMEDEFPHRRSVPDVDRRDILKMLGGAALLAGLGGCRFQPEQKIVPYVRQPEDAVAGQHRLFASSVTKSGYAFGVLVDQVDGRPIRVDGHKGHPASLGGVDARVCAEILNFYDPDRMKAPRYRGMPVSWREALLAIEESMRESLTGAGVAVLSAPVNSPAVATLAAKLKAEYPAMTWHQWEPVNRDNEREGSVLAYGQDMVAIYDFSAADVVVSLDSDALFEGPMAVRYCKDFAKRRHPGAERGMSRVYAFESHPQTIGISADHRARLKPSEALSFVLSLAARLGMPGVSASVPSGIDGGLFDAVVSDLSAKRGRAVIVPGAHLPASVHAACHALNDYLGAVGSTVRLSPNPQPMASHAGRDLAALVEGMRGGRVNTLLILGVNPVYSAPGDLRFGEALAQVKLKASLTSHLDETAEVCDYALPQSHFLEAWGDGLAYDGTYSIQQPLILPLYEGRSVLEFLDALAGKDGEARRLVQTAAKGYGIETDAQWREFLSVGAKPMPSAMAAAPDLTPNLLSTLRPVAAQGIELLVLPDPYIYDGRHSNNNWLQETPKPVTNLTWDNALLLSKATADRFGFVAVDEQRVLGIPFYGEAQMARVSVNGSTLEVPVWVNLGQADDVAVLHLGYGRKAGGEFARQSSERDGGGFDANVLRTSANPVWVSGVTIEKTGKTYGLANTQHHNTIDATVADADRNLYRQTTVAALAAGHPFGDKGAGLVKKDGETNPKYDFGEHGKKPNMSFYTGEDFKEWPEANYQWAMTIDLSLCTGCNACVTACQAENNIPTVGKREVQRGRELHWMRVDRYYQGTHRLGTDRGRVLDEDNPPIIVQPVTCMHCEKAPCEPVCPVAATVHSHEGLNQMVYNRCVGTRYCSNNCPYKVRRFNFFHYSQRADQIPVLQMLQNPEVTVRFRGVMEKCTYCVQRINKARIEAKTEGRQIRDGEVVTACESACPSDAIIFGDMRKAENRVALSRAEKRNYLMLEELNTIPRTTYLSRVTNPHPSLVQEEEA